MSIRLLPLSTLALASFLLVVFQMPFAKTAGAASEPKVPGGSCESAGLGVTTMADDRGSLVACLQKNPPSDTSLVWKSMTGEGTGFVGATPLSYNGISVGGYAGGHAKCNAAIPGSHMCSTSDFSKGGNPSGVTGWYNSFTSQYIWHAVGGGGLWIYFSRDCLGWNSNSSNDHGQLWTVSFPQYSKCHVSNPVLCCK